MKITCCNKGTSNTHVCMLVMPELRNLEMGMWEGQFMRMVGVLRN
jgi:hypothetical protein